MTAETSGELPTEYYVSDDENSENSNSSSDEGNNNENYEEAAEEDYSSESSGFESDDSSTSSDESMIMPYTIDDIQLPPHPKRIKWSDEASNSTGTGGGDGDDEGTEESSPLVSTRLIPGGRLGRHFWTLDDVPEGSSFRFSNVSNKERRRMRKERMNGVAQERKEDKKKKKRKDKADSESGATPQSQADGVSTDTSPQTRKITPDDCVSDHEDLDNIIGGNGQDGNGDDDDDDDDAESATSEGSGWGASRRLSDIGGDLEDEDNGQEGEQDDDADDEEETDENLAAGQRIEHSIHNMNTVQREKLVEAMMNDILKSMRAIEKRKREESEQQQKGDDEHMSVDSDPEHEEKSVGIDEHETLKKVEVDPIEVDGNIQPGDDTKAGTEEEHRDDSSGADEDESDFFVDLLTNENVDDFVQTAAVEWMDDAQKDDDDDDDEDEEDEFDKFLENYSSSRLSDGEEDSGANATGSLSHDRNKEDDELVFKHRFMDGGDGDGVDDEDTTSLKRSAVERRRKGSAPTASSISKRSQRPARPTLPPREISSKRNLKDSSKSASKKKKKKKKSFAKRMFKISLQGEIDETKRKMEMRRHSSHTSGLSDHDSMSISTDLNGSHGSFRSNATGRDSMGRHGGNVREQSMMHQRRPVPSGRHVRMQRSNNSGSTVNNSGSVDARRQNRNMSGGRYSVAKGQGARPPGSIRGSTTSGGRGRGSVIRPPSSTGTVSGRAMNSGRGRGGGERGTTMRASGRGSRGASQRATGSVRAPNGSSSGGRQSKNVRPHEGRGHHRRASSSESSSTGIGTGGKQAPASLGGDHRQQHDAATEGEKKKKKKLFKLNLKSELVDQRP